MDSSLLLVALAALWMAVLVPQWIRRRDQLGSCRSVDRFSHAMRVLARRPEHQLRPHATVDRPTLLSSPRLDLLTPAAGPPTLPASVVRVGSTGRPPRAGVVVLLTVSVAGVGALATAAVLGLVPVWVASVAAAELPVVVLALAVRARRLAVQRRVARRRVAAARRRETGPRLTAPVPPVVAAVEVVEARRSA